MKAITVTPYYESDGAYKSGKEVMITDRVLFGIPFESGIILFYDDNGRQVKSKDVELVEVHFENKPTITVLAYEFERLIAYL